MPQRRDAKLFEVFSRQVRQDRLVDVVLAERGLILSKAKAPQPNLSRVLDRAPALAPLRLAEIALARIGPPPSIAIKDFAKGVENFRSHPNTPACKGFTCSSGRAFLFPSSAHGGNFQQVWAFNFRFHHSLQCYERLLRTPCRRLRRIRKFILPFNGRVFFE